MAAFNQHAMPVSFHASTIKMGVPQDESGVPASGVRHFEGDAFTCLRPEAGVTGD